MRITLANWYGDHKPGETIDVDEVTAKALRRDGLVAEPEQETAKEGQASSKAAEGAPQPTPETQPEPEPQTGRKKR